MSRTSNKNNNNNKKPRSLSLGDIFGNNNNNNINTNAENKEEQKQLLNKPIRRNTVQINQIDNKEDDKEDDKEANKNIGFRRRMSQMIGLETIPEESDIKNVLERLKNLYNEINEKMSSSYLTTRHFLIHPKIKG